MDFGIGITDISNRLVDVVSRSDRLFTLSKGEKEMVKAKKVRFEVGQLCSLNYRPSSGAFLHDDIVTVRGDNSGPRYFVITTDGARFGWVDADALNKLGCEHGAAVGASCPGCQGANLFRKDA